MCFFIGHKILYIWGRRRQFKNMHNNSRIKEQCFQSNMVNCSPPSGANCFESDNSWTKFY